MTTIGVGVGGSGLGSGQNVVASWDSASLPLLSEQHLLWINAVANTVSESSVAAVGMNPHPEQHNSLSPNLIDHHDEDEEEYIEWRQNADRLAAYCSAAASLCDQMHHTRSVITDIDASYHLVSKKTSELAALCEELVRDQQHSDALYAQLNARLPYFDQLESIASKLNHPHLQGDETYFVGMLRRVDECVTYLETHPNTRDAQIYLTKYRLLQNRALQLLKEYIVGLLHSTATSITATCGVDEQGDQQALSMWRSLAPRIQPLASLVDQRRQHRDFEAVLADIYSVYFTYRRNLAAARLRWSEDVSLPVQHQVQQGCSQLIQRCDIESQLFQDVFGYASSGLRLLMESLAAPFYDSLRVRIVRSHSVDDLCLVVSIVNLEFLERQLSQRADLSSALKPILRRIVQDAQERLIFVSQAFVRDHIASAALSYPLSEYTSTLRSELDKCPAVDPSALSRLDDSLQAHRRCGWHPSLTLTVDLLRKLHVALDSLSFEGLAVEAVSACSHALCFASNELAKQTTKLVSHLFLVRHLVILEQELVPFNVNLFVKERVLDFGHIRTLLMRVLTGEIALSSLMSLASSTALYTFLQSAAPRLTQSEKDIKRDLHALLTQSMDAVLIHITQASLSPLLSFVSKAKSTQQPQDAQSLVLQFIDAGPASLLSDLTQVRLMLIGLPVASRSLVASVRMSVEEAVKKFNLLSPATPIDLSILNFGDDA
jgi:conserved oligomeric Golgi complex subunit 3